MVPAGEAAMGFICAAWYGTGTHFPLIQEMLTYVYARGKGAGPESDVGTSHWIRGVLRGLLTAEALRTAMRHFGNQPLTGAQVQWGLEHLSLTAASLKELGAEGLLPPITLSCRDHEGGGGVKFQQWDGTAVAGCITDWIAPDQALVRPLVEASAAKYAQEKGHHATGLPVGACPRAVEPRINALGDAGRAGRWRAAGALRPRTCQEQRGDAIRRKAADAWRPAVHRRLEQQHSHAAQWPPVMGVIRCPFLRRAWGAGHVRKGAFPDVGATKRGRTGHDV